MEEYSLGATIIQFSIALAFVIALLFLCAYLAKRLGFIARVTVNEDGERKKRLDILEIMPVDAKRRLVLIRRDQTEHLIMLGAERDIVIEQNIKSDNKNNNMQT
ncbi:FliO/MopB family protein [Pseudemcibacter aquimaris]|uniref:FliO/MopB family protein n=1 Tax=Pseudemcibacter aquimaris TaxID=2857064 RepID=UPI002013AAF8|nr:flagellar biosynthetic protein FliO [Pseudemcibacter aquimaris]MCC3860823.1 flagellar biosynthetic protein FliO [Pseudemcibacter aquimaris]WDU59643.1 flagellar biosynthetic protein FliO [Pseudemcibacter aquimaris]